MTTTPHYLADFSDLYQQNPRQANLEWFKNAKWGLFLHYGLYSQLERGEWMMFHERIPISEYEKLFDSFDPKNFDADFITDLALKAEMKYINITACHHEGFCLWKSDTEAFNSYTACKRDLIRELAEQCDKKGLGFFTYYTHVLNWRHPYAIPREYLNMGRPDYDFNEPRYLFKVKEDVAKYWEYAHACMKELLDLEYPLAGIWLDLISPYYKQPEFIRIDNTYKLIRETRPDILLSFKQGANGTEDFASPEFSFNSLGDSLRADGFREGALLADIAWEKNCLKHNEICMTLQRKQWGYAKGMEHYNADDIWSRLAYAIKNNCNMLTNSGPLPDGSIHPADIKSLLEVGRRIRESGWPTPAAAITPDSWTAPKKNENRALAG
jgi:alpha-L-fucosidase